MKISLTLGEGEVAAVRDYLSVELPKGRKPNATRQLMMKLARSLDKTALVPASGKRVYGKGRKIWDVVGRGDLKGKLEAAGTVSIGGEVIVTCWRMVDRESTEPCVTCGRALRGARVAVHGYEGNIRLGLGHKGCSAQVLGLEQRDSWNWSTAYQRFAVQPSAFRPGALNLTLPWGAWQSPVIEQPTLDN